MKPIIIGLKSTQLQYWERKFIATHQPWGIILFARNIIDPVQLHQLINECKSVLMGHKMEFLIDQEGGRVRRLKPPHWLPAPNMAVFGQLYQKNETLALQAISDYAKWQAGEFWRLGITINCAPLVDLRIMGAHDIIGDRALSTDKNIIANLANEYAQSLENNGILPVIKHIPGHGRAMADSHLELPVVHENWDILENDFMPFQFLRAFPLAMTAHIKYTALDNKNCATMSPKIINDIIRQHIGFTGLIMSDDLSMQALQGDYGYRARQCLNAGCDLVLHCNGDEGEMNAIANAVDPLVETDRFAFNPDQRMPDKPIDIDHYYQRVVQALQPIWQP